MPKLLQLNASVGRGSTGRIAETIAELATARGWDCYIAHGARYIGKTHMKTYQVSTKFYEMLHYVKSVIMDAHGLGSVRATKRLIKWIKELSPDVIHIHNLHGYWVNYEMLFKFLNKSNIPIVWTFHDCWAITGHCAMFTASFCDKWKTECVDCHHLDWYPKSIILDRSLKNFQKKRRLFTSSSKLMIVSVSNWLDEIVGQSYFRKMPHIVIPNGIDTSVFYPRIDTKQITREKYGLGDKIVVLSVADKWNEGIGLSDIPKLRQLLDDRFIIVIVGVKQKQKDILPTGVIGILHTSSRDELAELYTVADISFTPQTVATFGLVSAESMACGTPAIVYDAAAAAEVVGDTGHVVPARDIYELASTIMKFVRDGGKEKFSSACVERVLMNYDQITNYNRYIDLYNSMI